MRVLLGGAGVLLLLALLTWLLWRGIDTHVPAYTAALQSLDDFALAEASLQRDVLQGRAGLLRNYDSLGRATLAMEAAVARLRGQAQADGLNFGPIDDLSATVAKREDLIEQFKSSNALLQNSLSYVAQLSTDQAFNANSEHFGSATALAAAILRLTRNSSPNVTQALQEQIDQFAAQAPTSGPDAEAARALLAHARLLHALLPAVDQTLKELVAVPEGRPLQTTRALFADHQMVIETTAERFRFLLYLVSLLLVIALIRFGLQLRDRTLALRRRAAFEHVIAQHSAHLINCPPADTAERLEQVLAEFGRATGVDRVYVVVAGTPARTHAWCVDDAPFPAGWPEDALALSEHIDKIGLDIIVVRDVAALPAGDAKSKLAAIGLRSWACVLVDRPGRMRGLIGFDKLLPSWGPLFPLAVVRLAGDVIANAVEREFLERDRTRLAARLERARRMQMIGALASGIAHNFNNIIAAILGYSEMVESQLLPGSKSAANIEEIRRAAERGRDLIDNILSFGRQRDARVERVDVRTLFNDAAALLRPVLPTSVELVVSDISLDLAVAGEPAQLQQIIINLCNNAVHAIGRDGRIDVAAEEKSLQTARRLSHGDLVAGRYACLSVCDTGPGIDMVVARRLFEPFFTTRAGGTGLGLATVYEIVRDYGGAMHVESAPGQGSRFEAWLPAAAAEEAMMAVSTTSALGKGETVLVIESETKLLLCDEEMLAALGYEPVGFARAADAIAACRSTPNRFDAVVIGHTASASDGLHIARAIRKVMARQPILLTSGATIEADVDALAEVGVAELLQRPLVSTEVAAALARSLRTSVALRA
jgi:signal transduction histidine kinase/ActR/RegA family two-component response regulator